MTENQKNESSLMKNPLTFLAPAYPYFLLVLIVIGVFYVQNVGYFYQNSLPALLPDSTATDLPVKLPSVAAAIPVEIIRMATPEMIEKGKATYATVCASCHGDEGRGNGVAGAALNPKPRNFHDLEGWKNGNNLSGMYLTLQNGIAANGMPAYDNISPEERLGIIFYIRENLMENPPAITDAEVLDIDETYQLSLGTFVPGTIPTEGAIKMFSASYAQISMKTTDAIKKVEADTSEAAVLLRSVTNNLSRALTTLENSTGWNKDVKSFKSVVEAYPVTNGFRAQFFTLSDKEIEKLFTYLKGLNI
ncbi:MAG: cytochrome c [Ignavibacteriaceae bacterium]|nr:cytochrome c [Ignavibacteriaceae bacterium]